MSGGAGEELVARLSGRLGAFTLDVALSAPASGVTALVGPSGSGKTTVLRAIAGLAEFSGEVRLGGAVWQEKGRFTPPHRRAAGYVFQHAALFPHLSVRGNLDYGRRRAGVDGVALDHAVALLSLAPLLERAPASLSGGERQRVALARALLTRPRVLLLDEPLSGLDADAKAALLPELKRVVEGLGIPVLYVSHDAEEVRRMTDRVIRLANGRVAPDPRAASAPDPLSGLEPARLRALAAAALRAGLTGD